jgi:hypothetical protein
MQKRSRFRPKAIATTLLFAVATYATITAAADRVLLFAPGEYEHHQAAPYHANAAKNLHDRLLKANIHEDQMIWLHGREATATAFRKALGNLVDSTGPQDLLLVVLCSPGMRQDDSDYIFSADTPDNPKISKGEKDPKMIPVAEVVSEMGVSASNKRILLVDGASEGDFAQSDAAIHFGRAPIEVRSGQWVILNQSNSISARGNQPDITAFMWSFLDGIAIHADGNHDGVVTALELADYMKLYAEEQRLPLPRFAGKATEDMNLVSTSTADDETFPREKLVENARRLTTEARKALRLDLDVQAALALLDRASRLCNDEDFKKELDMVSASAKIMSGKAEEVLPLQARDDVIFEAVLPKDVLGYNSANRSRSQQLPAGSVVYIKNRVSAPTSQGDQQTYVCIVDALQLDLKNDQTTYTPIKLASESIWVLADDLVATTNQTVPPVSLRRQFMKTENTPQTPSGDADSAQ